MPVYGLIAIPSLALSYGADALLNAAGYELDWVLSAPSLGAFYVLLYQWVDRRVWRWRWLRGLGAFQVPVIAGRYEGQLTSEYDGGTIVPTSINVKQRWSKLSLDCDFRNPPTSFSVSTTAMIEATSDDRTTIVYTYANSTIPGIADADMTDHIGTCQLVINAADRTAIGAYFNLRGNRGSLHLTKVD